MRQSRGSLFQAAFANGEEAELKISKSSVSARTKPSVASIEDDVMRLAMGAKMVGTMTDEEIAETAKSSAEASNGLDEWVDAFREALSPAPRPGPGR